VRASPQFSAPPLYGIIGVVISVSGCPRFIGVDVREVTVGSIQTAKRASCCDHLEIEVRVPTSISRILTMTSSGVESLYSGDGGVASALLALEQLLTQSTAEIESNTQPKIAGII
jgi:hypothetical protein